MPVYCMGNVWILAGLLGKQYVGGYGYQSTVWDLCGYLPVSWVRSNLCRWVWVPVYCMGYVWIPAVLLCKPCVRGYGCLSSQLDGFICGCGYQSILHTLTVYGSVGKGADLKCAQCVRV